MEDSSARGWRDRFRAAESDASRLRLLQGTAALLAGEAQAKVALAGVLEQALRFLTADAGLVLALDAAALTVVAARGPVLPVGARIPAAGVLAAALRPPLQPRRRDQVESRLRLGQRPEVAVEVLVPVALGGRPCGLLALMSESPGPDPSPGDLETLAAVATLLAGTLQGQGGSRGRSPRRENAAAQAGLTAREQQVLALLPRGLSNGEIAAALGIAPGTAKIHVERILHKLGVHDRTQAAVQAIEWGYRT